MMRTTMIVLAAAAMLGACGKQASPRDVQKLVNEVWNTCVLVEAKDVKIESQDRKTVRYSYVLKMRIDGSLVARAPCPVPKQKMVEMLFNKDLADLKAGNETTVTQEATKQ